jgi:hypothetical protein
MHPIVASFRPTDKLYQMVTLTTKGGREITLTPESLFGLVKVDGKPVIKVDRAIAPLPPMRFDAEQSGPFFNHLDPRYWYIAGLVISGGSLPRHPTHAAAVYYPESRAWEAQLVREFLERYFDQFEKPTFVGRHPKTTVAPGPFGVTLASKAINSIIKRIGEREPRTGGDYGDFILSESGEESSLSFLHGMTSEESYAGFMAGFLAGMSHEPDGRAFSHRNVHVVRVMNMVLFEDFGIPTELIINPNEDPVMYRGRKITNPHTLVLHREEYLKVQAAGLAHWDRDFLLNGGPHLPLDITLDSVASILPAGEDAGHPVTGDSGEFVSHMNFLFHSEFEPNPAALDLATMKELFVEVLDPAEIIRRMPASMAQGVPL